MPCRRDKYQQHIREFWVDVATTGSYDNEQEEQLLDKTFGEGEANEMEFGLSPCDPSAAARGEEEPELVETDQEDDEDPGDDAGSTRSRRVPSKDEVQREHALEARFRFQPIFKHYSLMQVFDMIMAETFFALEGR